MMKICTFILYTSLSWLLAGPLSLQAKEFEDSSLTHVEYPDWFTNNPFLELNQDLANARARGKQGLMVIYGTEGCSYCGLFNEKSLGNPEIAAIIQKNFDSVGLEIFDDSDLVSPQGHETNVKDFAKQEGVMYSPTILFYAQDGKRVLRITGYQSPTRFKKSLQYVTGKHYQTQTMAEYIDNLSTKNTQKTGTYPLRHDPLFSQPPYILQRNVIAATTPLLVIFEQTGCEECDTFHNKVLADYQVRDVLKRFEVIRLDKNDNNTTVMTPTGRKITPSKWYQQLGFSRSPALLFFSEKGEAAIKTDNLILKNRMMNSLNYMLEHTYKKGWSYQRFSRTKAIERKLRKAAMEMTIK